MDFNHPLAGENLHYVGMVKLVRDATEEELHPAIVAVVVAVTIAAVAVTAAEIAATVVIKSFPKNNKQEGELPMAILPLPFL